MDVYKRLAKKLDELPNGYPSTDSEVELKILKKIFAPEEAEMALLMKPIPEAVEAIADRIGKPIPEMQAILDDMVVKGQIGSFKLGGQRFYMLFPFVIGIYEFQLNRMDKDFLGLVHEYEPDLLKTFGAHKPAVARVIPVQKEVEGELTVFLYEDVRRMIEESRSFQLSDCICRKEKAMNGHECNHTRQGCLTLSPEENAFDGHRLGEIITKEEATKVITKAEEDGLVHCTYNVQQGHMFICNCCSCCCGMLRAVKDFQAPYMVARSNFVASIDADSCAACGDCAEGRCPMDAITENDNAFEVSLERCIGCGVCTSVCPTESIALVRRAEGELDIPPDHLMEWNVQRAANRGIELKLD